MKELQKSATREGAGKGMLEAGKRWKNVVVLTADLGESLNINEFKKKFPKRFFECGVAEQNMAAVASGMAHIGKIPFITSFSVFSPGRNWEQIRTTICVNNANVKIIGSHAGVLTGEDGVTHQAIEDIATMRAIPNMTVIVPGDAEEARKAVIEAASIDGPVYIRVQRAKTPVFTMGNEGFKIGKAEVLRQSKRDRAAIIACGHCVIEALEAYEKLNEDKISIRIINCHTIKPIDKNTIIKAAKECKRIITVEDHNIIGGLGSAVAEVLAENEQRPLKRLGIKDKFGESGHSDELVKRFGIDSSAIIKEVKNMLKKN